MNIARIIIQGRSSGSDGHRVKCRVITTRTRGDDSMNLLLLRWINVYAQYEIENHADDDQGCPDQHDVGDFLGFVVDPSPDKRVEGTDDAQYPQPDALLLEQFDEDEDETHQGSKADKVH